MSLNDPIADMLTRIRNAIRANKHQVNIKASKTCKGIAVVLKAQGYIADYDCIDDAKQGLVRIFLKYDQQGNSVINSIERISKPGRRIYSSVTDLPLVLGGLGIAIISTGKGIMSDNDCRKGNVGGEILCTVN
jgi:small subunit ribosomal protein S8